MSFTQQLCFIFRNVYRGYLNLYFEIKKTPGILFTL